MRSKIRRGVAVWLAAMVFGALIVVTPLTSGAATADGLVVQTAADATPLPTNPPGSADGDPDDFTGTPWVLVAAGLVVVLAVGLTLLVFRRRSG